jgi:UDP-N-acetylmuramoylalanine--D-glutamate ligase
MKNIGIIGLGKTGMSVARFLAAQGLAFTAFDTRDNPPEKSHFEESYPTAPLYCGALDERLLALDTLIVSPGISIHTPIFDKAREKAIALIGDIELFAQHRKAPVIAITGSNGKTTVTTLMGEMCKAAGIKTAVGGNIGTPALDLLDTLVPSFPRRRESSGLLEPSLDWDVEEISHPPKTEVYVLELSSFQLETTFSLAPDVAVVLNITEDHMDRYRDFRHYNDAKQRIYQQAKTCVINLDAPLAYDTLHSVIPAQAGIQGPMDARLRGHDETKIISFSITQKADIYVSEKGDIICQDKKIAHQSEFILQAPHHLSNFLACFAMGIAYGLPIEAMLTVARNFKGLPHRAQWVAEKKGVTYINDSKATNVGATVSALESLGQSCPGEIILIAGGDGKSADFHDLIAPVAGYCKAVILLGKDAALIQAVLDNIPGLILIKVSTLENAVQEAQRLASAGDYVLLSPACASLDMFKNYEDRGQQFMDYVNSLFQHE